MQINRSDLFDMPMITYLQKLKNIQNYTKVDLPFDKEDANRYLPWVIAVMTALTVFMLAVGISLNGLVKESNGDLLYRLQIQLPYDGGDEKQQARDLLNKLDEISSIDSAEILGDNHIINLLEPWLGGNIEPDILPLPVIIDVWMDNADFHGGEVSRDIIHGLVKEQFPEVTVDSYDMWIDDFNHFTSILQKVAYALGFSIFISAIIIILLITRTSVQLHFSIVKLLHNIGAYDKYIARQFQINAAIMTLKGTAFGTILSALFFFLFTQIISSYDIAALSEMGVSVGHMLMFIIVPFIIIGCVYLAVQWTVSSMLRQLH